MAARGGLPDRYQTESGDVLDAVLANSRDAILLMDVDGVIEYASGGARRLLNRPQTDDALGTAWQAYWPGDAQDRLLEAFDDARGGERTEFEGHTVGPDDQACWWQVAISPVRDTGGTITHLLAVATDVTGRKRVRDERRLREEAEREADRAGDIAREMRHRLKNQLAVIGAVAKLLARHSDDTRELALKLEDKLVSLARAQDIVTLHRDKPIAARDAIEQVLEASGAGDQVRVGHVPEVELPQESVQQLALVLGELQTNALKHGALVCDGGQIELSGEIVDQVLEVRWHEHCALPVSAPEKGNGGFQLISRLGSAGSKKPVIGWNDHGIEVDFYVRLIPA